MKWARLKSCDTLLVFIQSTEDQAIDTCIPEKKKETYVKKTWNISWSEKVSKSRCCGRAYPYTIVDSSKLATTRIKTVS